METTLKSTTWHGIKAWVFENKILQLVVVPEMGAKFVSLLDKRSGREWLMDKGDRPFRPVEHAANFVEQDMSGWDEMFPTIVACNYPGVGELQGARLPDHGEVWTLPWQKKDHGSDRLTLSVTGVALPYRLTRSLMFSHPDCFKFSYSLKNLSNLAMPYLWAAHPQFVCPAGTRVLLPPQVQTVNNVLDESWGWGAPHTQWLWPSQDQNNSKRQIDLIGEPSLKRARKVFIPPELRIDWASLQTPSGDWLKMDWDSNKVPYFGLWVDEGALSSKSVAAPEPMTGYYDSLELAVKNERVSILPPGETQSWWLTVQVGSGGLPQ